MAFANYRKRRPGEKINKNELKAARNESDKRKAGAETLRARFPRVRALNITLRMEAATGAILEASEQAIDLDAPLHLDVPCQGGCSGGVFLLNDAVAALLTADAETRKGMGICQTPSYRDPALPCGTKFYYELFAQY